MSLEQVKKHLQGQHNQSSHGKGGKGRKPEVGSITGATPRRVIDDIAVMVHAPATKTPGGTSISFGGARRDVIGAMLQDNGYKQSGGGRAGTRYVSQRNGVTVNVDQQNQAFGGVKTIVSAW